jgi:hypothetical protein
VILRWPDRFAAPASVTGSPAVTSSNNHRIYTWTTVGTWSITF